MLTIRTHIDPSRVSVKSHLQYLRPPGRSVPWIRSSLRGNLRSLLSVDTQLQNQV